MVKYLRDVVFEQKSEIEKMNFLTSCQSRLQKCTVLDAGISESQQAENAAGEDEPRVDWEPSVGK